MTLNKLLIYLVIAGYLVVNVLMQINFFTGKNIWAKYYLKDTKQTAVVASDVSAEVEAGRKAYYAKTAFLLVLIIFLAFNVSFPLGFSISFVLYAALMLIFFGLNRTTGIFMAASMCTLVSYFIPFKLW